MYCMCVCVQPIVKFAQSVITFHMFVIIWPLWPLSHTHSILLTISVFFLFCCCFFLPIISSTISRGFTRLAISQITRTNPIRNQNQAMQKNACRNALNHPGQIPEIRLSNIQLKSYHTLAGSEHLTN